MEKVKKEKKKKRWWQILLIIVAVIFLIFAIFIGFSIFTIRKFTGDSLSWRGTLAMAGYGGFDLPDWYCHLVLGDYHEYENLPELLVDASGKKVDSVEKFEKRREELMDLYQTNMVGVTPVDGFQEDFELIEEGEAFDGKALRQQVKITITGENGQTCESMLLVYMPKDAEKVGFFVGENFAGNPSVTADEKVLASSSQNGKVDKRNTDSWYIEETIERGYGVATLSYQDWGDDDVATYADRLLKLFPDNQATAFSAWSFGYMRAIDYLMTLDQVDKDTIVSVGHSRLARVSLWAGAQDERITTVTASCGGGMLRSQVTGRIVRDGTSDHWFTKEYFDYENKDSEIPVETYMLYAMIADRNLYLSMGTVDLASDPSSTIDSLQIAKQVWSDIYGKNVISDFHYFDLQEDVSQMSECMGVHVHHGGHLMTEGDWKCYIDFVEQTR